MDPLKTTITAYGNGIFGIDQQMVRAFLLVGTNAALLLDTGAVRIDMRSVIKEITSLKPTVILTHGDGDHIGNLRDFPDAYVCEKDMAAVLSHQECAKVALYPLVDGQEFDIGGRKLKVLFTPGHTAGSVCLLDEANKILFAGDTVSYGPIFMFGERRNMPEYLNTLLTLKGMKDSGAFHTVYCCHNACPISADTVNLLTACIRGIMDKTIPGVPAPMPIPTDEKPLLGKLGECSVLF